MLTRRVKSCVEVLHYFSEPLSTRSNSPVKVASIGWYVIIYPHQVASQLYETRKGSRLLRFFRRERLS